MGEDLRVFSQWVEKEVKKACIREDEEGWGHIVTLANSYGVGDLTCLAFYGELQFEVVM